MGVDDVERVLRLLADERPLPDGIDGLDAFTLALIGHWDEARHPAAGRWVLAAAGNAGGPASAGKLAGFARAWPSARAFHALNALRANGALMHLDALTRTARKPQVRERADELLDAVAAERGLTRDQLGDHAVPTCGLDADGTRRFEIDGRVFTFALGPGLKPMLRDAERQAARDAAEAVGGVEAAAQAGRRRREDPGGAARAGDGHAAPLERRRTSSASSSATRSSAISRGCSCGAPRRPTFRITDELDYADVDDEPVTLDGRGRPRRIRSQLSEDERAALGRAARRLRDRPAVPAARPAGARRRSGRAVASEPHPLRAAA